MRKSILVVGSVNTDMVVKSANIPLPGETVLGGDFVMTPGGKGANQAVAVAKLGGQATFIAKIGDDIFGQAAIKGFEEYGIDTHAITIDKEEPSGVALIMVDDQGENCISVALGANASLSPQDIIEQEALIRNATCILVQLETPIATVEKLASIASQHKIRLILNPAPAQSLSSSLLKHVDIITPNETEAALLTGVEVHNIESAGTAAEILHDRGIGIVIITMGSSGAYVSSPEYTGLIPSIPTIAVDTTAAGDTFNGAIAVALAKDNSIREAVIFANKAAALSVTKMGAQASIPTIAEVLKS